MRFEVDFTYVVVRFVRTLNKSVLLLCIMIACMFCHAYRSGRIINCPLMGVFSNLNARVRTIETEVIMVLFE